MRGAADSGRQRLAAHLPGSRRTLDLLQAGGIEVLVPPAVVAEVLAGPAADAARLALTAGWGVRPGPVDIPSAVLEWGLGAGESSVIARALALPGSTAVVDDGEARRCARTLGVPVMGSLAIIIEAARNGHIPAAGPAIKDLRRSGIYLADSLVREALARALGEAWEP